MLVGPSKSPHDFNFQRNDSHLIVNDVSETVKAFNYSGKLLWTKPALARGVAGKDYRNRNADTPPGLYRLGQHYNDYAGVGAVAKWSRTRMAFGWHTFDMITLDLGEDAVGRAGICLHGGGSACGWPGAWAPLQQDLTYGGLPYTHGCVRMYNKDLHEFVLPLYEQGKVFVSVYQDPY